jgi:hypothetical protein
MPSSTFHLRYGWRCVRVRIDRTGGQLDHYYHFIMDFAWPLHHWSASRGLALPDRIGCEDAKVLFFGSHAQALLGPGLSVVMRLDRWLQRVLPLEHVALRGFNSRVRDHEKTFSDLGELRRSHRAFVHHVASRIARSAPSSVPQVILIDRGEAEGDRGASRRRMEGTASLAAAIEGHCRDRSVAFRTVRMEDLGPLDQVALVRSAPTILIGQHGAGLLNGSWMEQPGSGVIELAAEDNPAHFGNLFADLGTPYHRLHFPARGAYGAQQVLVPRPGPVLERIDALLG